MHLVFDCLGIDRFHHVVFRIPPGHARTEIKVVLHVLFEFSVVQQNELNFLQITVDEREDLSDVVHLIVFAAMFGLKFGGDIVSLLKEKVGESVEIAALFVGSTQRDQVVCIFHPDVEIAWDKPRIDAVLLKVGIERRASCNKGIGCGKEGTEGWKVQPIR